MNASVVGIRNSQIRYESVAARCGVPWHVTAVIHALEASLSFDEHLHNGDPLSSRTKHVPAGRPIEGNPPFIWEDSAIDALNYDGFSTWSDWSLGGTLFKLEGFNGWGYRRLHPEVLSPYLWSFSTHYTAGKFVKDKTWSATTVSKQCGAAVILRHMVEKKLINLL